MESIEKLRKYADGFVTVQTHDDLMGLIDQIEAEIAERYMELPTDADGEVIHIGDMLVDENGDRMNVTMVGNGGFTYRDAIWAKGCHHVKPRTLEDVLRDCCNEWNEHCGNDWEQSIYAKYADEIRGLL